MPAVRRVFHTPDQTWRLEYLDNGRINVIYLGHTILPAGTEYQVGQLLAEAGVDLATMVED